MLLHNAEDAPVLAIDFGLAVFFDPKVSLLQHAGPGVVKASVRLTLSCFSCLPCLLDG
jgi:hypothetical protein